MKKKNNEKNFLPELKQQNQFCDIIKCHVNNYSLANIIVLETKTWNLKWYDFLEQQEVHTKNSKLMFATEKNKLKGIHWAQYILIFSISAM